MRSRSGSLLFEQSENLRRPTEIDSNVNPYNESSALFALRTLLYT